MNKSDNIGLIITNLLLQKVYNTKSITTKSTLTYTSIPSTCHAPSIQNFVNFFWNGAIKLIRQISSID